MRRYRKGRSRPTRQPPPLTAEGVTGAVFGVIHTRICQREAGEWSDVGDGRDAPPIAALLNPLMAAIVLPYRNQSAAQRELNKRSAPVRWEAKRSRRSGRSEPVGNTLAGLPMRLTYRTLAVLHAIDDRPGASNHGVAVAAQIKDEGQTSKLLRRLQGLGLIENTGPGYPSGTPNAWRLTDCGREIVRETEQGEAVRHAA